MATVHSQVTLWLHGVAVGKALPTSTSTALADVHVQRGLSAVGLATAILISLCLFGASSCDLISFTFHGLVGLLEASPISQTSPTSHMQALSLPGRILSSTDMKGAAVLINIVFALAVIIGPVACCLAWICSWGHCVCTGRSPRASRFRVVRLAADLSTFLYAWSGLDVLWAAAWSATLEMDLVTQWLVHAKTGNLCDVIHDRLSEDCVRLEGAVLSGGWCLLCGGVASAALFLLTARTFGYSTLGLHAPLRRQAQCR